MTLTFEMTIALLGLTAALIAAGITFLCYKLQKKQTEPHVLLPVRFHVSERLNELESKKYGGATRRYVCFLAPLNLYEGGWVFNDKLNDPRVIWGTGNSFDEAIKNFNKNYKSSH